MRSIAVIVTIGLLFLLSCHRQQQETFITTLAPEVVEAKGHVVPKDSILPPRIVVAGKPKIVAAGKPTVVAAGLNIHLAGTPKAVIAGTPVVCIPGRDSFTLPKVVPAISKPFVAGLPRVVIAKDPAAKDENSQNFSSFNILQGLISERINSILQDKNGNIWFGSYGGGVARYDGKNFTNLTTKEGLGEDFIITIYEDKAGNIWTGTRNHGVSKYDGINFTNYTEKEGLCNNSVQSIVQDRYGNIWLGTANGISKYDGKNFINFTSKEGLIENYVNTVLEDDAARIWIGTDGGVSIYNGENFTNYTRKAGLSSNNVLSMAKDKDGNFWFGTDEGTSKFDGRTFTNYTEKDGLSSSAVKSIVQDKSGNFWFGTEYGGISKYDGKYFTHFTEREGLSNNGVDAILEDRSGILWFGTDGGGVCKYNGRTFTQFTKKEGLSNNDVWNFLQDKSGNIWIPTQGGGVDKYNGTSFSQFTKKEGLSGNDVWSVLEDISGNIWLGIADGGIVKYDGKTFTNFTKKEGLCDNNVRSMIQDRAGNFWIGTYYSGVSKFDGKTFTNFTVKEGLSDNQVFRIFEDRSGNIWFGTREDGVTKYDGKTFTHYTTKEGLLGNAVLGICEDKSGKIWFATSGGLTKYDGRTFTHFTEKEGLNSNKVWSVLADTSGNVWAGTSVGLNKLPHETLLNLSGNHKMFTANKADDNNNDFAAKPLFKSYTYEDGFLGIDCNIGILEDRSGNIWVGTTNGPTIYHPGGEIRDTNPPNIQLTSVSLFNENLAWAKDTNIVLGNGVRVGNFKFDSLSKWYSVPQHLSLAYNNNYLTFSFIGITTRSPQRVKYQYKLDGLDKNWSVPTIRTEAPYGNLPHGSYIFKVKAMNSEGYWSREFNYRFTIRPPWWQTWWAYCLYGLLFISAVNAVHRFQKQRLLAAERERTRERELIQAKEIEKAYRELKTTQTQLIQSEKMASLGELTAGIAHEIQNPLNFVNNFSEVNREMIAEMKSELLIGNTQEAISIANDIEENEQKISHHGKRADAIVKGMLQHSRSSAGKKELTDINALADEYLRLSYHGLRAKDKSFNATIETHFDESVGKIEVVPQDIGRVLLNLFNNAFYAVKPPNPLKGEHYDPKVTVTTKRVSPASGAGGLELRVKDNGIGIPQKAVDKIFQPFFTTKPAGQGTGLGLSLSYDIIKAHGGELKVETREGEGAEFIIQLPTS